MLTGFRDFILRGKVAELAVAVIIGAAFTNIVGSLTKDILNPIIAAIIGTSDLSALVLEVHGAKIAYGNFLNAVIAFVLVACVVYFLIVTPLSYLLLKVGVPPMSGTKMCPHCLSAIPAAAMRCSFCAQEQPETDTAPAAAPEPVLPPTAVAAGR